MKHNVLSFTTLMLLCALAANVRASVLPPGGCDTLTTVEGKTYLVSNVEELWQELRFTTCDDASRVYSMPRDRVASVKKAKPVVIPAPPKPPKKVKIPLDPETRMVKRTENLGVIALCCTLTAYLYPIGFVIGLIAICRAAKQLSAFKKHPNYKVLRRKLRDAMIWGGLASIAPLVLLLIVFVAVRIIFAGWRGFDFSFDGLILDPW